MYTDDNDESEDEEIARCDVDVNNETQLELTFINDFELNAGSDKNAEFGMDDFDLIFDSDDEQKSFLAQINPKFPYEKISLISPNISKRIDDLLQLLEENPQLK